MKPIIDIATGVGCFCRWNGTVDVVPNFDGKLNGEEVLPGFELDLGMLKGEE